MITTDNWHAVSTDLLKQASAWSQENSWPESPNGIRGMESESLPGSGFNPDLWIETPGGTVVFEVFKQKVLGADGRIDLMAYPTLRRVMLLYDSGNWRIRTDSGIDWPTPWNKETYYDLVDRLVHGK